MESPEPAGTTPPLTDPRGRTLDAARAEDRERIHRFQAADEQRRAGLRAQAEQLLGSAAYLRRTWVLFGFCWMVFYWPLVLAALAFLGFSLDGRASVLLVLWGAGPLLLAGSQVVLRSLGRRLLERSRIAREPGGKETMLPPVPRGQATGSPPGGLAPGLRQAARSDWVLGSVVWLVGYPPGLVVLGTLFPELQGPWLRFWWAVWLGVPIVLIVLQFLLSEPDQPCSGDSPDGEF